jgi:hypothetical protein
MKVVIQQVDMDTALTAMILGVASTDEILISTHEASPEDLADPEVLCIEAGGSGQVALNNFDHHNTALPLPPACRQALEVSGRNDPALHRLVDYVATLDAAGPTGLGPSPGFPTLSDVFSGMRLTIKDPVEQLKAGLAIFATVLGEQLDPFGLMPEKPEWRGWIEAKRRNDEELARAAVEAEVFVSSSGIKVGFLQTDCVGALGALYGLGCEVAIAYNPRFSPPSGGEPIPKYTIGGNGVRVDHLLPHLNALEPGWGGPTHGTIIASPRTGSRLDPETVKQLVRQGGYRMGKGTSGTQSRYQLLQAWLNGNQQAGEQLLYHLLLDYCTPPNQTCTPQQAVVWNMPEVLRLHRQGKLEEYEVSGLAADQLLDIYDRINSNRAEYRFAAWDNFEAYLTRSLRQGIRDHLQLHLQPQQGCTLQGNQVARGSGHEADDDGPSIEDIVCIEQLDPETAANLRQRCELARHLLDAFQKHLRNGAAQALANHLDTLIQAFSAGKNQPEVVAAQVIAFLESRWVHWRGLRDYFGPNYDQYNRRLRKEWRNFRNHPNNDLYRRYKTTL